MAAPVPTVIPAKLAVGDTLLFDTSLTDYDAATWTLTYYFQKLTPSFDVFSFAATANGRSFRVNVAATDTTLWTDGLYSGQAFVTSGGQRFKVWDGQLCVLPNNALLQQTDTRSYNRKVLDTLRACQLKLAAKQTARATIEGVDLFFKDPEAIERLIVIYQTNVAIEEKRLKRTVLSVFTGAT